MPEPLAREEAHLFLHGPARFAGREGMPRRATLEAHLRVETLLADRLGLPAASAAPLSRGPRARR